MKIKFNQNLIDPKGQVIETQEKDGDTTTFTLGKVAYEALLAQTEEKDVPPKYELYKLAKKTVAKNHVEITIEELSTIKKMIEKIWATVIVGAAFDIIENVK